MDTHKEIPRITVCVISGPTLSGKTFTLNWLRGLPKYSNAPIIEMDKIRQSIFGDKKITDMEHRFKNEATLHVLKSKLITERPGTIFLEMGLPTEEYHQKPLVKTISEARQYLNAINSENNSTDTGETLDFEINLQVILTYCDIESVKRRLRRRTSQTNDASGADVFNIDRYLYDMSLLFEIPSVYSPLPINTSDESSVAILKYREEILSFLNGNWPIDSRTWEKRMAEYKSIIDHAKKMHKETSDNKTISCTSNKFQKIKLLALDCDGVMTDGTTFVGTATLGSPLQGMTGSTGIEMTRFNHRDGAGIHALIESGVPVIMITSQMSEYVVARGEKLRKANGNDDRKFTYFCKTEDKVSSLLGYLEKYHSNITPSEVCYMGDDIGDIPIMKTVGLPVAVRDAQPEVKEIAAYITEKVGGDGAVREVCDLIRKSRTQFTKETNGA